MPKPMQPVTAAERHVGLDVLRGAALLGVLLVNLHSGFRVSLFAHILSFHTHTGWANRATDILLAWIFEFKAFTLLSLLFGVGVQAERAARQQLMLKCRYTSPSRYPGNTAPLDLGRLLPQSHTVHRRCHDQQQA
jgi:uncharacterized membrane protein YeiB